MIPVLIIGYGNPLRSDDGIGWHAANALVDEWPPSRVRVEAAHQLLPEMADWLAEAEFVVFIDACWEGVPGRIRLHPVRFEENREVSMTHHFSPQGLLADAWHLFHHCPEAVLVSVAGESFEHGEGLSQSAASAFPNLLSRVTKLVQNHRMKVESGKADLHA